MKNLVYAATACGMFLLLASVALAHGGQYTGPAGGGTTGGFAPAGAGTPGPGPGPAGGGTGTPGGTTPGGTGTTPGSGPGGGPTGGPTGAPPSGPGGGMGGAPGAGAGTTGGGYKKPKNDANITWGAWWFFNDDKYLNIKARIRATETATENADLFFGSGGAGDTVKSIPAKKIREGVIPTLQAALKDPHFDTRAAAAIALGKCGMEDALAHLKTILDDEDKRVRESACLAMGILGNKEAIPMLIEVMNNSKKGQDFLGREGGDILSRTRAFAAMSIGLIGSTKKDVSDTQAVSALIAAMKRKEKAHADSKVGPIVALGVMKAKEAVPELIDYLKDRDNPAQIRAYAANALGKIGDPSALKVLTGKYGVGDKHNPVVQSSVIALGLLVSPNTPEGKKTCQKIRKMISKGADRGSKNFAIISLGEIGGIENRNFLAKKINKGNQFEQTFSAIALGVYAHKDENKDPEIAEIAKSVHKVLVNEKSPEKRGAAAISLALMKHEAASADILKMLQDVRAASLRSHLVLSLGMLGHKESIKTIRGIVKSKEDPVVRRNAAIALGLLGDKEAMEFLRKEIKESEGSLTIQGAVTQGLGFIGDVTAVKPLCEMVSDVKGTKDGTRAFAAVALGLLGDKSVLPVLSVIAENNNYLNNTDALAELLTIL